MWPDPPVRWCPALEEAPYAIVAKRFDGTIHDGRVAPVAITEIACLDHVNYTCRQTEAASY